MANPTTITAIGLVTSVRRRKGALRIWFHGGPGSFTVPIIDAFPPWMCKAGAEFRAEITARAFRDRDWPNAQWSQIENIKITDAEVEAIMEDLWNERGKQLG